MSNPIPPVADKRPFSITTHAHTRNDDYHWLREKEGADTISYLEAENAYTKATMAHTEDFQDALYKEMIGRIQETDEDIPVKIGNYFYYSRTQEGLQYPIYCRKFGALTAPEEIVLNMNTIAPEADFLTLGVYSTSPDHNLVAYALDTTGAETFTLYVKDLRTGVQLADVLQEVSYSVAWSSDNKTLFYVTEDEAKRSDKVWRHTLGTAQSADTLCFHEPDELFRLRVGSTKDEKFIFISTNSIETSEEHFLDSSTPNEAFQVVEPRQKGVEYDVDHRNGRFYIVTNADTATNFKLMTTNVSQPSRQHWREQLAHRPNVKLEYVSLYANHMIYHERKQGLAQIRVEQFGNGGKTHTINFPEAIYAAGGGHPDYHSDTIRLNYTSLITPSSLYDYNINTRERELLKQQPVLGGYDPANYDTERIWATANDGTKVPISLVYKKGLKRDSSNPCLLYGYGSYGINIPPSFRSTRLSLIDRGFVFAIAHIRGSETLGRQWYEDGKFLNKRNTFTDFINCAEHLIAKNYTAPSKIAIQGGSAGGLLMGAVINMAPELFAVCLAAVPFVDVVTTMLDESIPLTVNEFEEWGNPKDEAYYHYMLSYSPYDNVVAQHYPHLLVTAGLNDPRVQYWEPAKWVAKLRDVKVDDARLLLKTNMGAGHQGASGRYDYLKEIAFEYAFILDTLGFTS